MKQIDPFLVTTDELTNMLFLGENSTLEFSNSLSASRTDRYDFGHTFWSISTTPQFLQFRG